MDLLIKGHCQTDRCRGQQIADIFSTFIVIIIINMEDQKNTNNTDDRDQKRIKDRHFKLLFQDQTDLIGDQTYHCSEKCGVFYEFHHFSVPLFPIRITPCVTFPVTTITITVLINVMMRTGTQIGFRVLQAVISPAPAGTNITGMISTRKICRTFDLIQLQNTCEQSHQHNDQSIDTGRYRKWKKGFQ